MLQAQVPKPVPARIAALKHRDKCTLPVVFFGTNEILWAEPKDHKTWGEGVREGLHGKAKGTKGLKLAILEVKPCLPPSRLCLSVCLRPMLSLKSTWTGARVCGKPALQAKDLKLAVMAAVLLLACTGPNRCACACGGAPACRTSSQLMDTQKALAEWLHLSSPASSTPPASAAEVSTCAGGELPGARQDAHGAQELVDAAPRLSPGPPPGRTPQACQGQDAHQAKASCRVRPLEPEHPAFIQHLQACCMPPKLWPAWWRSAAA